MNSISFIRRDWLSAALLVAVLLPCAAQAAIGVREAAVSLERQLQSNPHTPVSESLRVPLTGSTIVLSGEAKLERLDDARCRRTLELVHDKPFERRGLRITNISRQSVQEGGCSRFADAMVRQAALTAQSIAEQIGVTVAAIDSTPGERVLVAHSSDTGSPASAPARSYKDGAAVTLTVLEKAIIRDAPSRQGERLSRADAGTRLKAWRIPDNAEWFVLDGGLRFIHASVVDVTDVAIAQAPARGDTSRIRVRVMERAVLRNAPSFTGKKVASLAAGVERIARKVPGIAGWFELTDSENVYPLYIHESVVAEKPGKPAEKRL